MAEPILIEQRDSATIITLNRPEKRNALSIALMTALCAAVDAANNDTSRRAIILRGAGEGFCAGLDLKEATESGKHHESAALVARTIRTVHTSKLPTIAAVHGFAMAGGAGLMAACDLAVAAQGMKIGYPEVRRGMVPALISTLLRLQVRDRELRELVLCGESIDVERARELGIVNRVVPMDQLIDEAMKYVAQFSKGAPGAIANTKALLGKLRPHPIEEDLEQALSFHEAARTSDEATEGIAAFLEKREPNWKR